MLLPHMVDETGGKYVHMLIYCQHGEAKNRKAKSPGDPTEAIAPTGNPRST